MRQWRGRERNKRSLAGSMANASAEQRRVKECYACGRPAVAKDLLSVTLNHRGRSLVGYHPACYRELIKRMNA